MTTSNKIPDLRSVNRFGTVTLPKRVLDHWRRQYPNLKKVAIFELGDDLIIRPYYGPSEDD